MLHNESVSSSLWFRSLASSDNEHTVIASVNPPAVVAIHHSQVHRDHGRLMGPPPVPHHTSLPVSSTTGPHVVVPGPWQHTSTGTHHSSNGRGHSAVGRGYTANHVQYGTERERWAKMSYVVPPAETISLEISAVHEGPGRRRAGRGVPFGVSYIPWSRWRTPTDRTFRIYVRAKRMLMHALMLLASLRLHWILCCRRSSPSPNSAGVLKSLWYEMEDG
jgi:hypothetical protein